VIVPIITYERSALVNSEKYIGLDIHQTTNVVAVMDSTGKLVMESILETKAVTVLQFFAGLRGTLSVAFEEGTWSAWLCDLLHSRVDQLVVCNPRKNALLKDGNKSDRIDACKLADLLRGNQLKPVYHGETGVRMLRELFRSYLTIAKDSVAGDEPAESGVPQLGDSLCGQRCLLPPASSLAAGKNPRSLGAASRGTTLSAAGHVATLAAASAPRTVSEKSQAYDHRQAATDSLSGADSSGAGGGPDPDSASFPHQATTLGL
jgi:hypothetical protein